MAFDLENAIQRGFNSDPNTNDAQIDARSLSVKFDDAYGSFSLTNSNNETVLTAESDGYLGVAGNVEVAGGNVLVKGATNTELITLQDTTNESSILLLNGNPNTNISAPKGSIGLDYTDGYVYANRDGADTWERFAFVSETSATSTFIQKRGLDINGAVLNGKVKINTNNGTPSLDFPSSNLSRASWSIPVPADWDGISNLNVNILWSPSSTNIGGVTWRLEYKVFALTELINISASTTNYIQSTSGTAYALQSTDNNLFIPNSALLTTDNLIVINIVRLGDDVADTFSDDAQVHLVQYSYTAQNII